MSNKIATVTTDDNTGTIQFDFGEAGGVSVALSDLPDEIVKHAAMHGLVQRLRDAYAGYGQRYDADAPTRAMEEVNAIVQSLQSGEWSRRGEGGGGGRTSVWAEAFARVLVNNGKAETVADGIAVYQGLDRAAQAAARGRKVVIDQKHAIENERATSSAPDGIDDLIDPQA